MVFDQSISWTFNLIDNVTPTVENIQASQGQLAVSTQKATQTIDSQNISWLKQMAAVTATYMGMRRLTSSLIELGLVSDKDAKLLHQMTAAIGLVAGGYQLLKGGVAVINALRASTVGLAAIETYRSVLSRGPVAVGLVAAGLGIAAGVGGYFLGQSAASQTSQTQVTQNITFGGGAGRADQRATARETIAVMGG